MPDCGIATLTQRRFLRVTPRLHTLIQEYIKRRPAITDGEKAAISVFQEPQQAGLLALAELVAVLVPVWSMLKVLQSVSLSWLPVAVTVRV